MAEYRRYGLIGSGMMGCEHIRNLALVPGTELVAIAEPNDTPRTWAVRSLKDKASEVTFYDDHLSMLREQSLDAVIVATPNFTHRQIADDLFDHDVAVLMEKPLSTTFDDAAHLVTTAKSRSQLFWVGLEYRFMPPVNRFIERLHSNEIGTPRMLAIREHRFPFLQKVDDWNRFNAKTGGTMVEKCCHFFDLMRHVLQDEPVRIYASGAQDVNHKDERIDGRTPDILDNAFVIVDFAGGTRASLDLCMFAEGSKEQEEISVVGDRGKLEVFIPSGIVRHSPREERRPIDELVSVEAAALKAGYHHGATYHQLTAFHHALVSGGDAEISAFDGFMSVQMGIAAQQSIESGAAVTLKP